MLLDGVDAATCRRLVVQEAVVLPARNEKDIATKTAYSNLKAVQNADGASWIAESGKTVHVLHVARSLDRTI